MIKKSGEDYKRYIFWGIVLVLIFFSYLIIKEYIVALITAFVLAYLVKPLYKKLNNKINKQLSALICTLLILLIIIVFLTTIFGSIIQQTVSSLSYLKSIGNAFSDTLLANINVSLLTEKVAAFLIQIITSTIPQMVISTLIMVLGIYYILVNWDTLIESLKRYIPFKNKQEVSEEIAKSTNALIYGSLLIAILEFIVATVGFYFAGAPFFLVLAALVFIFAFLPGLGPIAVWIPLAFYTSFIQGDVPATIIVVITGLILSIGLDMAFRVKILGERTRINPLIMLVGIVGGVSIFGIFGFIIGPLVLVYTIKLLEEAMKEK